MSDNERLRRHWDQAAPDFDRRMGLFDRWFVADTRAWICGRATGTVLEVAVGTGLNLPLYDPSTTVTGIEWSPAMLAIARRRAATLDRPSDRPFDLREGDAQALDFPDETFDTVVCTFSLCAIPDDRRAVEEMIRVLRPGGRLLLADHVAATNGPTRLIQRLLETVTIRVGGEHFRRRPLLHVKALGLDPADHDRFKLGIIERFEAIKPI
jgi:ubiquinone/menaquinone biosynthesis C-methylase UbiE